MCAVFLSVSGKRLGTGARNGEGSEAGQTAELLN